MEFVPAMLFTAATQVGDDVFLSNEQSIKEKLMNAEELTAWRIFERQYALARSLAASTEDYESGRNWNMILLVRNGVYINLNDARRQTLAGGQYPPDMADGPPIFFNGQDLWSRYRLYPFGWLVDTLDQRRETSCVGDYDAEIHALAWFDYKYRRHPVPANTNYIDHVMLFGYAGPCSSCRAVIKTFVAYHAARMRNNQAGRRFRFTAMYIEKNEEVAENKDPTMGKVRHGNNYGYRTSQRKTLYDERQGRTELRICRVNGTANAAIPTGAASAAATIVQGAAPPNW